MYLPKNKKNCRCFLSDCLFKNLIYVQVWRAIQSRILFMSTKVIKQIGFSCSNLIVWFLAYLRLQNFIKNYRITEKRTYIFLCWRALGRYYYITSYFVQKNYDCLSSYTARECALQPLENCIVLLSDYQVMADCFC